MIAKDSLKVGDEVFVVGGKRGKVTNIHSTKESATVTLDETGEEWTIGFDETNNCWYNDTDEGILEFAFKKEVEKKAEKKKAEVKEPEKLLVGGFEPKLVIKIGCKELEFNANLEKRVRRFKYILKLNKIPGVNIKYEDISVTREDMDNLLTWLTKTKKDLNRSIK